MIKEHKYREFYQILKKHKLKLKNRLCCGIYAMRRIEYYPGYGVRISCPCGDSCLTLKRAEHPEIKTEEDFVVWAAERWNAGQNDIWY